MNGLLVLTFMPDVLWGFAVAVCILCYLIIMVR
jgi:hypothetical protein